MRSPIVLEIFIHYIVVQNQLKDEDQDKKQVSKDLSSLIILSDICENAVDQVSNDKMIKHVFAVCINQISEAFDQVVNVNLAKNLFLVSFLMLRIVNVFKGPLRHLIKERLNLIDSARQDERRKVHIAVLDTFDLTLFPKAEFLLKSKKVLLVLDDEMSQILLEFITRLNAIKLERD